jgi:two-component system chemotaxis response regulator CheB
MAHGSSVWSCPVGLSDGTLGLIKIRSAGGVTVVQDPDEAVVKGIPLSAIRHVTVDHVVSTDRMAALLARLARALVSDPAAESPASEGA